MTKFCATSSYKQNKGARTNLKKLAAQLEAGPSRDEKETLDQLSVKVIEKVRDNEGTSSKVCEENSRLKQQLQQKSSRLEEIKKQEGATRGKITETEENISSKKTLLHQLDQGILDLKEANRKIAADFDDNRAALNELADWQSAVGCSISTVQRDFEAYAKEVEEQAERLREKLKEEQMVETNNQIELEEEQTQLKFEKSDLETRYEKELRSAGDILKHNKIEIELMKNQIRDLQDSVKRKSENDQDDDARTLQSIED